MRALKTHECKKRSVALPAQEFLPCAQNQRLLMILVTEGSHSSCGRYVSPARPACTRWCDAIGLEDMLPFLQMNDVLGTVRETRNWRITALISKVDPELFIVKALSKSKVSFLAT